MSDRLSVLRDIEAAAVRGWPALEAAAVDGWLWRYTSGGSIRANSVAALDYTGIDVEQSIAACEGRYAARGASCVFTITEVVVPADLDAVLEQRGYRRGDDHVTMAKRVDPDATLPADVAVGVQPTNGWMEAYLSGLSPDRRGVAPKLIANLPDNAVFVSYDVDNRAISSGLTVVDGRVASVQCMATLAEGRRKGAAQTVLGGIEAIAAENGVEWLYLQTGGDNIAAQSLYRRCGFEVVSRYHTRQK